jgi:hypothetical protein
MVLVLDCTACACKVNVDFQRQGTILHAHHSRPRSGSEMKPGVIVPRPSGSKPRSPAVHACMQCDSQVGALLERLSVMAKPMHGWEGQTGAYAGCRQGGRGARGRGTTAGRLQGQHQSRVSCRRATIAGHHFRCAV